jgi:hypothetical protein
MEIESLRGAGEVGFRGMAAFSPFECRRLSLSAHCVTATVAKSPHMVKGLKGFLWPSPAASSGADVVSGGRLAPQAAYEAPEIEQQYPGDDHEQRQSDQEHQRVVEQRPEAAGDYGIFGE